MPVTVRNADILFNNGTTQSTAAVVDTTSVLNATAAAAAGAVGTYATRAVVNGGWTSNTTLAGSSLATGLSGTWRAIGTPFPNTVHPGDHYGSGARLLYIGTYLRIS